MVLKKELNFPAYSLLVLLVVLVLLSGHLAGKSNQIKEMIEGDIHIFQRDVLFRSSQISKPQYAIYQITSITPDKMSSMEFRQEVLELHGRVIGHNYFLLPWTFLSESKVFSQGDPLFLQAEYEILHGEFNQILEVVKRSGDSLREADSHEEFMRKFYGYKEDLTLFAANLNKFNNWHSKFLPFYFSRLQMNLKRSGEELNRNVLFLSFLALLLTISAVFFMVLQRRSVRVLMKNKEELRLSEELFRQIAENVRGALWICSSDWKKIIYCGPTYEEIFGDSVQELYEDSAIWQRKVIDEDLPAVIEHIRKMKAGDFSTTGYPEFRIRGGDNQMRWIKVRAFPVLDQKGNVIRIAGSTEDITDSKMTQLALQESKEKYRTVVEGTDDLITIVNPEGVLTYVNHISETILGVKPEECLGLIAFDFIHHEDRQRTREWFKDCLDRKVSTASIENRQVNRKTGAVRHTHWTSSFFYTEDGKLTNVTGIARDITDFVKATEDLQMSQLRLSEAQKMANLGYWDWDAVTGAMEISDELYRVLGQVPGTDEWSYEKFLDIIHPDDRGDVNERLRSAVKSGNFNPFEHKVAFPDGLAKIIRVHGEVFQDERGRTVRMAGTAQDITERRGTEDLLRESEELFKAILTNAQAIIFIIAKDGTFLLSEGKGLSSLGLKPGQVVGQSVYDIYKDFPTILKAIKDTHEGKTTTDVIDVGGIYFDIFYTPYTDRDGNITGTIGMAIDITKEKRSREALARSEQLAAVGEVASGIAHELNNPLATISGCTEVLLDRFSKNSGSVAVDKDFVFDYLGMIMEEVKHSTGILHDLLDFARNRPLTKNRMDMTELTRSTVNLLQIQSRFSGYYFFTSDIDDVSETFGDRSRLRQVVIILLTNAAEAMPEGGNITVSLRNDDGKDEVRLEVADQGVGIKVDDVDKIFEPYYTTKISERGTGLGLAIARNIMDQHNGKISVRSSVNRGSTFTVSIPLVRDGGDES